MKTNAARKPFSGCQPQTRANCMGCRSFARLIFVEESPNCADGSDFQTRLRGFLRQDLSNLMVFGNPIYEGAPKGEWPSFRKELEPQNML